MYVIELKQIIDLLKFEFEHLVLVCSIIYVCKNNCVCCILHYDFYIELGNFFWYKYLFMTTTHKYGNSYQAFW